MNNAYDIAEAYIDDFDTHKLKRYQYIIHNIINSNMVVDKNNICDEFLKLFSKFICKRYFIEYVYRRNVGQLSRQLRAHRLSIDNISYEELLGLTNEHALFEKCRNKLVSKYTDIIRTYIDNDTNLINDIISDNINSSELTYDTEHLFDE